MELTVQNVYGLLLRSKLMSVDQAKAMFARWQEEAKDGSTNLMRFAQWMVANRYVTEYQASLLARGHAEGFFLNEYKILDRLGKGRMAGVYKAQHHLGQVVAIKVLPPSKSKDPTLLARFQREARLAMKLRHPNIVRGFQLGIAGELQYLVMEHLDGETVEDVLERRNKLTPSEAVRIAYQALEGLQHIHAQGLVHRDLKPANLMLVPPPGKESTLRCTVKILDIGLGRGVGYEEGPGGAEEVGLTSEGVLLGTPDYMAPEQARDPRSADIRADIYSLGCVLYHLLAGQPPFPDTNIISQMIRHATEPPRPLRELNPAVVEGLEKIIGFMMAKDPAARYPTPERAAQGLQVFLAAGAAPLSSPDLDPGMKPYLNWVEAENGKASAAPPPALAPTIPLATLPPPPAVPSKPPAAPQAPTAETPAAAAGGRAKAHKAREAARRKGRKQRKPTAGAPAPADVAPSINVELVELDGPKRGGHKEAGSGLTRRDLLVFGAGVIGGAAAALTGRWLAAPQSPSPDPAPETQEEPS